MIRECSYPEDLFEGRRDALRRCAHGRGDRRFAWRMNRFEF